MSDDEDEWLASPGIDDDDLEIPEVSEMPELSPDQLRMLYMISKYSHAANGPEEKEEWIRKIPLLVLIYEGITHDVFDYDYAPASEPINDRRIYFNISQEGRSDIDALREFELLNALKLSSKEHQAVTAFQISHKGSKLLDYVSKEDRSDVNGFIYAPKEGGDDSGSDDDDDEERDAADLLKVNWDGEDFHLKSDSGYVRDSLVTDTEDVSYVSSPYIPACLRHGGREITDNSSKAYMSASGETNIRDELDEVLVLNNVSIMVGEFIPFGTNQMLSLNQKLGVTDRVQGGFFTALVDEESGGTKFEVPPGLTKVTILDYHISNYVNLEADIYFPEDQGIVQIENFGVHICQDGTVCYGMFVESVMDNIKDGISLDFLARLLVDVHQDSSRVTDSFVAKYQLGLLDLIFGGDRLNRDKINIVIGDEIVPKLPAEKYMDRGPCENELKQCLGETRFAYDISEEDVIIFGNHGIMLGGETARHHEVTLYVYLGLVAKDMFTQNFFGRCFLLQDHMHETRKMMDHQAEDPNMITIVRERLANDSKDVIAMQEMLTYLKESIDCMTMPTMPSDPSGRKLYEVLDIGQTRHELNRRVVDLQKNTVTMQEELQVLVHMCKCLVSERDRALRKELYKNTFEVKTVINSNYANQQSLGLLQAIMCVTLGFALIDRFSGTVWSATNRDWAVGLVEPLLSTPFMYLFVSLGAWFGIAWLGLRDVAQKHAGNSNITTAKLQFDEKMNNHNAFNIWIMKKNVIVQEVNWEADHNVSKVVWLEDKPSSWGGHAPRIEVVYDSDHWYLNSVTIHYQRSKGKLTPTELRARILDELRENHVIVAPVGIAAEDDAED